MGGRFLAGGGEQVMEGGAGGAFVGDFVRGVAGEFFVVGFDFLVGRFELVGEGHGVVYPLPSPPRRREGTRRWRV